MVRQSEKWRKVLIYVYIFVWWRPQTLHAPQHKCVPSSFWCRLNNFDIFIKYVKYEKLAGKEHRYGIGNWSKLHNYDPSIGDGCSAYAWYSHGNECELQSEIYKIRKRHVCTAKTFRKQQRIIKIEYIYLVGAWFQFQFFITVLTWNASTFNSKWIQFYYIFHFTISAWDCSQLIKALGIKYYSIAIISNAIFNLNNIIMYISFISS